MIKKGKLKVQLFLEGDTESYYFKGMKKGDQVEIQYEEVTMDGGGYTNFLNKEVNVYQLLNSNKNHKDHALESIRNKPKVLKNQYRFKKKGLDMSIKISKTEFDPLNQTQRGTNIEEFFDIIQP